MQQVVTFAVLGDSAASGIGDADANGVTRGWGYYLTKSFVEPVVYLNLSRPGAQSAEVFEHQLPLAKEFRPSIAAVIVGGNDALRNSFSPDRFHNNLRQTIMALKEVGAEVLLLQLHDPTRVVPLPSLLGRVLRRRINSVNFITQNLAIELDAKVLNTRTIANIYDRKVWHIDRMHPSKHGHQILAQHFRAILLKQSWNLAPITIEATPVKNKAESMYWMLRNGTPWFLKRSVDLFPAALLLMAVELFKTIFRVEEKIRATVLYPAFISQTESKLQEVYEERVS